METAYRDYCHDLASVADKWNGLIKQDLPVLNDQLAKQKLSALPAVEIALPAECQ
jgi:hypothetical protein